jgi:long-chain fatty acid transport protein
MAHSSLLLRIAALATGVSVFALLGASAAQAGAFGLREQSAVGQGLSFAGAAAGGAGMGSMFWNPATITMNPGIQTSTTLSGISPYAKFKDDGGSSIAYRGSSSGDVGQDALLGSSYGSWQINDSLWLGYQLTTPFGLVTKPDATFPGRTYGNTTKVMSIEAAPTIGYRFNDMLSFGASLRVMHLKVKYASAVGGVLGAPTLEGDNIGVGFSLGATFTPMPGTSIGIGFRSAVEQQLSGDFTSNLGVVPFKANAMLPEQITIGVRQQIGERFTALAGVEWTNWSRLGFPRVINQATGAPLAQVPALPLDYKDGWFFSVGGEYVVNPEWTVRAGLGYEVSPIEDRTRNLRLPDNDRIWASLGATYNWSNRVSFDIGYTHIFPQATRVNIAPGNPTWSPALPAAASVLSGKVDGHVDIIAVAWKFRWDDPSKTVGVLPVKAKY